MIVAAVIAASVSLSVELCSTDPATISATTNRRAFLTVFTIRDSDDPLYPTYDSPAGECMRLLEIGEATRALPPDLLAHRPEIPWGDVIGARNRMVHHYFDKAAKGVVRDTITHDLGPLRIATVALLGEQPTMGD